MNKDCLRRAGILLLTAMLFTGCSGGDTVDTGKDSAAVSADSVTETETEAGWQYPDVDYEGGNFAFSISISYGICSSALTWTS